jgi:hypothetical protein
MIDAEKAAAIKQLMLNVTVPIFCKKREGIDHVSTGTLFEIEDRYFLVTARHVFDDQEVKDFSIPYNPVRSQLYTLGRFMLHKPDNDAIDVAVLEIQEERTIDAIKKGWRLLKPGTAAIAAPKGIFMLCGYPSQRMSLTSETVSGSLIMAYTTRLDEVPSDAEGPIDERLDLFFHHATNAADMHGRPSLIPHLGGTSGASVWQYYEPPGQSVWAPETSLRIVGVQSSVLKDRFIRAKSWEFVMAILRKIDPPLVPAL